MSSANDGYRNGCDATAKEYEERIAALKVSHQTEIAKLIADTLRSVLELCDQGPRENLPVRPHPLLRELKKRIRDLTPAKIAAQAEERDHRVIAKAKADGLQQASKIIDDVSQRFMPDFGTLILTAQSEISEAETAHRAAVQGTLK